MKIKYLIDTILTPKISVLDFVDRYAGIVRTINIAEGNGTETGIVKRYPVACNVTGADCANIGIYQNLVPDDSKKSIVYWEMIQPMANVGYTSTRNFFEKRFRGTARLVVWLNLAKLGIENCTDAVNIIPILEKEITMRGKIMSGIFAGAQLRIQPLRMVNQEINTVFGKYDYNKLKNFYLYPFDFFAIDVQFTLEQCLDKGGTFPILPAADCVNQIPAEVVCKSLEFDGVNEFLNCTNNALFNFDRSNSFSFENWIKFDNLTGTRFINSKIDFTTVKGYYLATVSNNLRFAFFNTNLNLISVNTNESLNTGVWYHIVVTYDGSSDANNVKFYINNTLYTNNVIVNTLSGTTQTTEPLQIGGQDTFFTAGQIAKTRIWNVELTASEVATMYNGGTIQNSPVQPASLIVNTDINNAVFGTQFTVPDLTGVTSGYTSINMESGDLLSECPS